VLGGNQMGHDQRLFHRKGGPASPDGVELVRRAGRAASLKRTQAGLEINAAAPKAKRPWGLTTFVRDLLVLWFIRA